MLQLTEKLLLETLKNYLVEIASELNLGMKDELSIIIHEMSLEPVGGIYIPALATGSWQDWKRHVESTRIAAEYNMREEILSTIKPEQSFVAAGKFLNEIFWEKNHGITIGDAFQELDKCSKDIREDKINFLWDAWIRYLAAELDNEYTLDFHSKVKSKEQRTVIEKIISSIQWWKK